MASPIKYKVDSSFGLPGTLEPHLNTLGASGWELINADDSGLLVLKDSSPDKYKYKVANGPIAFTTLDIENYLNPFGAAGWDLVSVSVATNVFIFKAIQ
jgi:hypothetical protein